MSPAPRVINRMSPASAVVSIGYRRPGNRQKLPLPLAEVSSVGGKNRVISLRQMGDEKMSIGQLGCCYDLLVGGVQLSITDIVPNSAGRCV